MNAIDQPVLAHYLTTGASATTLPVNQTRETDGRNGRTPGHLQPWDLVQDVVEPETDRQTDLEWADPGRRTYDAGGPPVIVSSARWGERGSRLRSTGSAG